MSDGNIHQWLEKIFTDREAERILELYNAYTGSNLHLALLPFLDHETLEKVLHEIKASIRATAQQGGDPDTQEIEDLLRKLDEDQYWVDVTTIADPARREYNTVTEQHRLLDRYDDADEIFGNVRSTL